MEQNNNAQKEAPSITKLLKERLSLFENKADDSVIDERIRGDVEMRGANLWVLMFAIFIASIGLNVNSTAVIIGAMLISPLMGPIMGIGYGAGINDFSLLRKGFKNLAIATVIALTTSTLYFLISPLSSAQSELLARTTPTVWDVLIGFFGGLAGIVATTRKEKTNVIPGVAIATALMPPLCTAGFGLATGNINYFFGAFYLYIINFVFIALSSFLIIRVFNISEKKYVDAALAKKAQRYIIAIVIATILPSSYLAYELVDEEIFKSKANTFVATEFNFQNTSVSQLKINPKTKTLKVFLIGEHIPQKELNKINSKLQAAGLGNAKLRIYQNGEKEEINLTNLKADIISDLYKESKTNTESIAIELNNIKSDIAKNKEYFKDLPNELKTIFPDIDQVVLSETYIQDNETNETKKTFVLNIDENSKISKKELSAIESWLKTRTKQENVKIFLAK
jgi:uncharacterized hydrophobic protein (TIGR00271 family)